MGGWEEFFEGLERLPKGSGDISKGSKTSAKGFGRLTKGSKTFPKGSAKVLEGSKTLPKGSGKVLEGSKTLPKVFARLPEGTKSLAKGSAKLLEGTKNRSPPGLAAGATTAWGAAGPPPYRGGPGGRRIWGRAGHDRNTGAGLCHLAKIKLGQKLRTDPTAPSLVRCSPRLS